ncbi:MAG: thiamine-phosphate kinase [Gemmatimonadales bacterium]|nr:thiamine-phosphate kinase [Gemmatimonadales bacterium]
MKHLGLGPGPEFDRIRAIAKVLGDRVGELGDDCAVLERVEGSLVISTDLSIEGQHFRREWLTPEEIGWRAAAAGLSDLAAEGADPIGVLASVAVPRREANTAERIMAGVGSVAVEVGARVLGGDLSAGPFVIIDVTAVGQTVRAVTRSGAKPGDGLWVTGRLGGARAALDAWRQGREPDGTARDRFARPVPRIAAGQWLSARGASAMIDLSDGLAGDAAHLAAASQVGLQLELDHMPVDPAVVAVALDRGIPPQRYAAEGGEDYELLVALPAKFSASDARQCQTDVGTVLTKIGEVVRGHAVRCTLAGVPQDLAGFDHFA